MTDNTQPEALDLADWLEAVGGGPSAKRCAALLREQHARIAEMEAPLASIGAGGVTGPLIGQPQAMPDLSQLTERGAKAWVGVDAQGLREGGADMSKEREAFERALTELAARYDEAIRPSDFSRDDTGAYHNDLTEISWMLWQARTSLSANAGFTAADMETASAQGFRDGAAYVAASAGSEPVASRAFLERALSAMEGVIDVADRQTDEFEALRSCVIDLTLMLFKERSQREARPCHVFTVRKAGPLTEWAPTTMALALPDGEHALYTHPSPPEGMVMASKPLYAAPPTAQAEGWTKASAEGVEHG